MTEIEGDGEMKPTTINGMTVPQLLKVNFEVLEYWQMECPHCYHEQNAPFNEDNPMQPMKVECKKCHKYFILTYDRE